MSREARLKALYGDEAKRDALVAEIIELLYTQSDCTTDEDDDRWSAANERMWDLVRELRTLDKKIAESVL